MPSSLRRSTRKILIAIILCVINTYSRAHAARSSKQRTNRSTSFEVKPSKTSAQFNYNRTIAHKLSNVLEKEFEDYDEEEYADEGTCDTYEEAYDADEDEWDEYKDDDGKYDTEE